LKKIILLGFCIWANLFVIAQQTGNGKIHGKVNVSELLSLKATSKLLGDIVTGKITIEPNATFTGTCNMGPIVKNISNVNETKKIATEFA